LIIYHMPLPRKLYVAGQNRRVWPHPYRAGEPSQKACCDAVKNKLLDSYRGVREAAQLRQFATRATKGHQVGELIPPPKTKTEEPAKTRDIRAKAAGTNARYIDRADRLMEEEPEVFEEVKSGKRSMAIPHRDARRKHFLN
jgi:hypothetical protein